MILTAGGKEVQFWVHLDNPDPPAMDASTSGRPPLAHQSLLRAASSFKEKSPATIYRSLSADGTRIYDSIKHPPPEENKPCSLESSSSSGRIQYPNLQQESSTSSVYDSYPSSSSLQQRSSSSVVIPPAPPPLLIPRGCLRHKTTRRGGRLNKETVDTWDRVFFQGVNTDVTIYTNDGHELDAHSMVLVS